jgi:hypothetical protein
MTDKSGDQKSSPRVREFVVPGPPWEFIGPTEEEKVRPRPEGQRKSIAEMRGRFPPELFEGFEEAIRELRRGTGPRRDPWD